MIPAALYRPDVAMTNPGVSDRVLNVLMSKDANGVSYGPHPSLAVPSGAMALPGVPRGGLKTISSANVHQIQFGTTDAVHMLDASFQWTEVENGFALPTGDTWGRTQFNYVALWTNTFDGMFAYDIDTPAGLVAVSTSPKFKYLARIFDCVFGFQADGDPRLMRSSAPTSYTEWDKDGARWQEFTSGEELMGAGELSQGYGVVLQRQGVTLLERTGDRRIFSRRPMSDQVGAQSPDGIVVVNGAAYFVSDMGFHRVTPAGVENIGADKVDKTFVESLVGDFSTIEGVYDAPRNRVVWRFASKVGDPAIFDYLIAYDIKLDEFTGLIAERTTALLAAGAPRFTADNASALGNADTVPYGPDSRFWTGDGRRLLALDPTYKAGWFEGPNLAPSVDTEVKVNNRSLHVTGCVPVTDASAVTVQAGSRSRLADTPAWDEEVSADEDGFAPVDVDGKAHVFRMGIPAGEQWSFIRGIDGIEAGEGGNR